MSNQPACLDSQSVRDIDAVETAVAAFLGRTGKGPVQPTRVSSWSQFEATFGAGVARGFMADAVEGYFLNGGATAFIVRVGSDVADDQPLTLEDYLGAGSQDGLEPTGLSALDHAEAVTMVCVPDLWSDVDRGGFEATVHAVQGAVIEHCERLADRIAILDAPPDLDAQQAYDWRVSVVGYDSKFAVLYFPWLKVFDETTGTAKLVPPSGHIAGVWARTDTTRGVHKAATNEVVRGVIGVGCAISRAEHELLDPVGVNCVRAFLGRGVRVWGSRTLSSDPRWQDISVRRVVSHVEASIRRGTRWLAHQPNDAETRARLVRVVRTYLFQTLLSGALVGESVNEAFRVECVDGDDHELVCEVGLAPKTAGEFTVFRLVQRFDDEAQISE